MRRLTGRMSNPFKPLTLQERVGERPVQGHGHDAQTRTIWILAKSVNRRRGVKNIKRYHWLLKLIVELGLKGPWKARMHDAVRPCCSHKAVFSLHAALNMEQRGGGGGGRRRIWWRFFSSFNGSCDFNDRCPDFRLNDPLVFTRGKLNQ